MKSLLDILYDATDRNDIVLLDAHGVPRVFKKLAALPISGEHYAVLAPRSGGEPVAFKYLGRTGDERLSLVGDTRTLADINGELDRLLKSSATNH